VSRKASAPSRAGSSEERSAAPPSSRRERRRTETRERLFEAALNLFSERDFDSVTVEMITEAAEVGKGTFFNYFDSKEAIVAYLFELQLRRFTEPLQAMLTALQDAQEPPVPSIWERVMAIGHQTAEQDKRSKSLMRTLLALSLTNPAVRAASLGVKESAIAIITELVRLQQRHRELRDDLPAESLAYALVHTHFQVLYTWAQSETDDDLTAASERAYMLLYEGLRRAEN